MFHGRGHYICVLALLFDYWVRLAGIPTLLGHCLDVMSRTKQMLCAAHADFSYEVSRSLAACQGALLLVDAAQGVQAQTVANFFLVTAPLMRFLPLMPR